jgi:hypothetical protein
LSTSSPPLVRLGSQEPVILHTPPDVVSHAAAEEIIQLANAYGIADGYPLSDAQGSTLRNGMGERADGLWAATRIAHFGPRQGTGKNDVIAARELGGLLLLGEELIIHTAHEFPTANESFLRLVAVFENWDDLRAKVSRIRYANGEQGIELKSGQRLKYRARTGGSGRGFAKADLVVYDEAQHLGREHIAASGPAKLANPNSQTWYAGSGGLITSGVAWGIRRDALSGNAGRLAYTEMTGETVSIIGGKPSFSAPDPTDRDVWFRCINGLGRWVTEEGVAALYDELGPELFAREILCVWDPDPGHTADGPIPLDVWESLTDGNSMATDASVRLALDVGQGGTFATFAVAGIRADALGHVAVRDRRPDTDWVLARGAELAKGHDTPIIIVKGTPAAPFADDFERAGVAVDRMSPAEYAEACGRFIYATRGEQPQLRHRGDPNLRAALAAVAVKDVGDGAVAWGRKSSTTDITALTACTMAWGRVGDGKAEPEFYVY